MGKMNYLSLLLVLGFLHALVAIFIEPCDPGGDDNDCADVCCPTCTKRCTKTNGGSADYCECILNNKAQAPLLKKGCANVTEKTGPCGGRCFLGNNHNNKGEKVYKAALCPADPDSPTRKRNCFCWVGGTV